MAVKMLSHAVEQDPETNGLALADLRNDCQGLARLLVSELRRRSWLDAYLLACGMNQIAEDHLHRDLAELSKVAHVLRGVGAAGRALAAGVWLVRAAGLRLRRLLPGERRTVLWQQELAELVCGLGRVVAGEAMAQGPMALAAEGLEVALRSLPGGIRHEVLRLPTCFRSLDQHPKDCAELARLLVARLDHIERLVVVGLRTSGSYLAPLLAAYLRSQGGKWVEVMTLRPGQGLLRGERHRLTQAAQDRATVVLCDDPPATGGALAAAAALAERAGVRRENLMLAVPLLEEVDLPEKLQAYAAVTLPADRWHIRRLLDAASAHAVLERMFDGHSTVLRVERLPLEGVDLKTDLTTRRHASALYRVLVTDAAGATSNLLVYAKGVGLGYLGRHATVASTKLSEYHPRVFGLADGVMFREWIPERLRASAPAPSQVPALASRIAGYVAYRAVMLPAALDWSVRLGGRNPVWQRVADRLGRGFGRARPLVRPALHAAARRLLAVRRPAVVDGSMALAQWFSSPNATQWVKVDYDQRSFSNEELAVYDPIYDLACAAGDAEMEGVEALPDLLRKGFKRLLGSEVDDERWLLYRVQHLAGFAGTMRELLAAGTENPARVVAVRSAAETAAGRTMNRYVASHLLAGIEPRSEGCLCAIDIDGVLETSWLGFSALTPAGVLAVAALLAHERLPVLASGRSLDDVRELCRLLRLPGGVAEYGAVAWIAADDASVDLLLPDQRRALERVRAVLAGWPGVFLDAAHRWTVRASRLDSDGVCRELDGAAEAAALAAAPGEVRAVHGWAQTDFVPAAIDKGRGLRFLVHRLQPAGGDASRPLALAVGDTLEDLPMLALARRRFAPGNASPELGGRVRMTRERFQRGLARAVAAEIGHMPGGCATCRPPSQPRAARLLLAALAAQDATSWGKLRAGLRLGWELLR